MVLVNGIEDNRMTWPPAPIGSQKPPKARRMTLTRDPALDCVIGNFLGVLMYFIQSALYVEFAGPYGRYIKLVALIATVCEGLVVFRRFRLFGVGIWTGGIVLPVLLQIYR